MIRARSVALAVCLPVAALLVPDLRSKGAGIMQDDPDAPPNFLRAMPSCGHCHRQTPGGNFLDIDVVLSARSLTPGQSISVTTSSTGGRPHALNWGGFSSEVDAGTFSAGSNSRVGLQGRGVTHTAAFLSNNRTWQYGYTAPSAPGPIDMFVNVNTVDGDGYATPSDIWGFHGYDTLSTVPTPVRLYVNVAGVTPVGDSCSDRYDNFPVLGSREAPRAGNRGFAVELIGAATGQPFILLLGPAAAPFDLGLLGITGCTLHLSPVATVTVVTSTGRAMLSEGSAAVALPLPAGVAGSVRCQGLFLDPGNGRGIEVTFTNALDIRIS